MSEVEGTQSDFEEMRKNVQQACARGQSCEDFTRQVVEEYKNSDDSKIASEEHNREMIVSIIGYIREIWNRVN